MFNKMLKISLILLIFLAKANCLLFNNLTSKIIFMGPKDSNKQIQLNNKKEFGNGLQKGWYLEANKEYLFFIKILVNHKKDLNYSKLIKNRHIENHIYYIYFTQNKFSCSDYLNYTHIPIFITEKLNSKQGSSILSKEISFMLRYEANPYYICLSEPYKNINSQNLENILFFHQGNESYLTISTFNPGLPLSFKLFSYIILVLMYATFNGLNLGLMCLSVDELELLIKTSDSNQERKYAQNILPLRKKGNYLLCSILLSIAMTSSVSILILEDLVEGLLAGILSTLILCIIGEIIPQAICTKYSLPIGSYTRNFTYFFIYLTSFLSYPLSKIVDFVLGKEIPTKYNRDSIKELIKKSIGLKEKQCQIISGALDLKSKKVSDIMVSLDRVYMIQEDEDLNFEKIALIYNSGYSRIPVYKDTRENIVGWFHIKDMTLIDPDDGIKVNKLISIYQHQVVYCYHTDSLGEIFDMFRKGTTHMAFVLEIVQDNDNRDPYEKCIGIVTFHDVIETLLQFDIKEKPFGINYLKKMIENQKRKSLIDLNKLEDEKTNKSKAAQKISLQTKFMILQILTNIKPFKEEFIDKAILEKLVDNEENYVCKYVFQNKNMSSSELKQNLNNYLYRYMEPSENFYLLVEGNFLIEAGTEMTEFYAKQFDHYGEKALLGDCERSQQVICNSPTYKPYIPEFSLKIDSNNKFEIMNNQKLINLIYLKIDRSTWLNAVNTTNIKRNKIETVT